MGSYDYTYPPILGLTEVIHRRTPTGKVFDRGDGTLGAIVHAKPIHFFNSAGELATIDLTLVDDGLGNYVMAGNQFSAGFRQDRLLTKYMGIRHNNDSDHQFELTPHVFKVDNVAISLPTHFQSVTVDNSRYRVENKINDYFSLVTQLHECWTRTSLKVNAPLSNFELQYRVDITGYTLVNSVEPDGTVTPDGNNEFVFQKNGDVPPGYSKYYPEGERIRIRQPLVFTDTDICPYRPSHTLTFIEGVYTYTKISTPEVETWLGEHSGDFPFYIDANETVYGDTSDGFIGRLNQSTWALARDEASGTMGYDDYTEHNNCLCGALYAGPVYSVLRSFFMFNTSFLGGGAEISSATVSIYGYDQNDTSVSIQLGTQSMPLSMYDDFNNFSGTYYDYETWSIGAYNDFPLNSQGLSDINQTGYTKYCAREYPHDYVGDTPIDTTGNGCYFADATGTTYDPKLYIVYIVTGRLVNISAVLKKIKQSTVSISTNIYPFNLKPVAISACLKKVKQKSVKVTAGLQYSGQWIYPDSTTISSFCNDLDKHRLADALDGPGSNDWGCDLNETHWCILDLGQMWLIKKFKTFSDTKDDPQSINVYISTDGSTWGTAVGTGFDPEDTETYQEFDFTDKVGRYIKFEIDDTEDPTGDIGWGAGTETSGIIGLYVVTPTHAINCTSSAVLGKAKTKTVSVSTKIQAGVAPSTKTVSVSAVLQAVKTSTVAVSGILSVVKTSDVNISGVLSIPYTTDVNISGLLKAIKTSDVDVSSILKTVKTADVDISGVLCDVYTADVNISGVLASVYTADVDVSGVLKAIKTCDVDISGILFGVKTSEVDISAVLGEIKTATVDISAGLAEAVADTVTVNISAVLKTIKTQDVDISAVLGTIGTSDVDISSVLKSVYTRDVDISGLLNKIKTATVDISAGLTEIVTETVGVNISACLCAIKTNTVAVSSVLKQIKTLDVDASGVLATVYTQDVNISTSISKAKTAICSVSSVLQAIHTRDVAISTRITSAVADTVTVGVSCVLKQGYSETVAVSAVLATKNILTVQTSGLLQKTKTVGVNIGVCLYSVKTKTVSISAILFARRTVAISTILQAVKTQVVNISGLVMAIHPGRYEPNIDLDIWPVETSEDVDIEKIHSQDVNIIPTESNEDVDIERVHSQGVNIKKLDEHNVYR